MATNMYVKFCPTKNGIIEGECKGRGHEKWCVITSLSQTIKNKTVPPPIIPKGDPVAKTCKPEAIEIKKIVDKASGKLMWHCWYNEPLEKVVIECFRSGKGHGKGQPIKYYFIELENVTIKKFGFEVDEGDLVTETLDLEASKAIYRYKKMDKRLGTAVLSGSTVVTTGDAAT